MKPDIKLVYVLGQAISTILELQLISKIGIKPSHNIFAKIKWDDS